MADWDGEAEVFPHVERAFRQIVENGNSGSAEEARRFGLLRRADVISRNADRLLYEAKQKAMALAAMDYEPPSNRLIWVSGEAGFQPLQERIERRIHEGAMTEHDGLIATKIAFILTGGDVLHGQSVSEEYLMELEREALISLAHEPKSVARMKAILETGKPLKN